MPNEETNIKPKTFWEIIPRKIAGGIAAMFLVWKAAVELKDAPFSQFCITIIGMVLLGSLAIWTHYLLERGSKKKKVKHEHAETVEDLMNKNIEEGGD